MNAPIRTLTAMPAAIQRERELALQEFLHSNDALDLAHYRAGGRSVAGPTTYRAPGPRVLPAKLTWDPDYGDDGLWFASDEIDGHEIQGTGCTAYGACIDMMRAADRYVQNEDEMRREGG